MNLAASIGIPTSFISFSFSASPAERVIEKLKGCHKSITFHSRDPKSKDRFEKFTDRTCYQVADLAFSMRPNKSSEKYIEIRDWIKEQKENSSLIIGLNINQLPLDLEKDQILSNYLSALNKILLAKPNLRFVFIPHDFREKQSDDSILSQLLSKLDYKDKVIMLRGPFTSDVAKAAAGELDLLMTGRMHLAIAALSQGVPSYCFTYKNKFEGLMQLLGLNNNLFSSEQQRDPECILETLNKAIENHSSQHSQLAERLSSVKEMSAENLK